MNPEDLENAIAIVGMSGRFPGADSIDTFWENLCNGRESISLFSDEELLASGVSKSQLDSPNYVKSRGILNGIELFDADFFGLNAKEAQLTDPQHRLFLECAWEALENAGYWSGNYQGSIGVYGGTGMSSYYLNNIYPDQQLREALGDFLLRLGNDKDYLTTRVSYKLNLKGPSINIQSACSTSLVAICVACNHLLTYQCDMALAGGVTISVPQSSGYVFQEGMIFSSDGHCRPFDAEAKGTVMSNGAGIVVLKRLQDAQADKDHIYAVIRGYGINNDGSGKIGYTAPSAIGQAEAIAAAIMMAGVDPETISYAETHGTATVLGDPIEIQGLSQAFNTAKKGYCAIGSVKSNIGHTFEAAGVIGLIKAVLALYYRRIPPSLNYHKPNPLIDFTETPFYINTELREWPSGEHPRRACVSSFGIGGTNAHMILEEPSQRETFEASKDKHYLILSARSLSALKTTAHNLGLHLKKHPDLSLANVAYTLKVGRKLFEHRRILTCHNRDEAISSLLNFDPSQYPTISNETPEDFVDSQLNRVPLPTYPFEKKRYWIDPSKKLVEIISSETPQRSIEEELRSLLIELLGIETINIDDDFFQIGGDSIFAIQLLTSLSKLFNINVEMHILQANASISKLTKVISKQKFSVSSLVQLKPGNTGSPLFLIHPIEGNLFCYTSLIEGFKSPNTIYGIQAINTENKSIEDIAAEYIKEIQKIQKEGPYNLLGMSFGGLIAYEMARQLEEKGSSLDLLCMVDVGRPEVDQIDENALLINLVELLEGIPAVDKVITPERVAQSLGFSMLSKKEQETIYNRVKSHLGAYSRYRPQPYGGKVIFFEAAQKFFRREKASIGSSWQELIGDRLEIQIIPGNHMNILKQPQVESLISFLNTQRQFNGKKQHEY